MKLFHSPGACSLADHIALIESGLPFEAETVDLRTRRTASGADFTAINPKGYVPALVLDDGEVLTENIAILSFIAATTGKLGPVDGIAQWRVLETLAFISTELHKNYKPFFSPGATDAAKAQARDTLVQRLALVEAQLGERGFIVGDMLSGADCYLFVMLLWAAKVGVPVPPRLAAYAERLGALPSFARALADEGLR